MYLVDVKMPLYDNVREELWLFGGFGIAINPALGA